MKSLDIEQAYEELIASPVTDTKTQFVFDAINELKKINTEVTSTTEAFGYKLFPDTRVHIGEYGKADELNTRFFCHNNGSALSSFSKEEIALVTGFGTTDSPSPGTLSMIFRLLELQKNAGIYVSAIVSDFGTLNSRNIHADTSAKLTLQFIQFIENLGFDYNCGELRTHNNKAYGALLPLVTSCLSISDFVEYTEATDNQYQNLEIFRGDFAMYTYKAMMATDILLPLVIHNKKAIVVTTGLEEHYHPNFARFVGNRFKELGGGYDSLIPDCFQISALYSKMINGFFPYAKMSRSIPGSSLCIGDTEKSITEKIRLSDDISNIVIYQMMELMTGWDEHKIQSAKRALLENNGWKEYKEEFLSLLLSLKKIWENSKPKNYVSFSDFVFGGINRNTVDA